MGDLFQVDHYIIGKRRLNKILQYTGRKYLAFKLQNCKTMG
jgi:hypothetical protein